ncbi:MAG: sigma-70 family RNA polymerase sigma factor [Bacteroidota bacterium]
MELSDEHLRELYSYRPSCVSYLRNKTNCEQDVAENLFIEAVIDLVKTKNKEEFSQIREKKTFLIRTCYNHWKRMYYAKKRDLKQEDNIAMYFYDYKVNRSPYDVDEYTIEEERLSTILNVLSHLGDKCKKIIRFFYYEKKSMPEIAEIMGFKTPVVATSAKYRCLKQLREKVGSYQQGISPIN